MHDLANSIFLTSDFAAHALSMPAGTGLHSLIHATIKKFGHNTAVMANDSAKDLIEADRTVQDTLIPLLRITRLRPLTCDKYHMGANFLTKRSRIVISAPAPLGALGSYLFNCPPNSTLSRSLLIRKEIVEKKPHRWHQHCRHHQGSPQHQYCGLVTYKQYCK